MMVHWLLLSRSHSVFLDAVVLILQKHEDAATESKTFVAFEMLGFIGLQSLHCHGMRGRELAPKP